MCQACVDAAKEVFPEIPDDEVRGWLLACTCYPFGDGSHERKQIKALRDLTADWHECYAIVDRETENAT
jgi:hypothetical protein